MRRPTRFLLGFVVALATYVSLHFLVPYRYAGWHRYGYRHGWHSGYYGPDRACGPYGYWQEEPSPAVPPPARP